MNGNSAATECVNLTKFYYNLQFLIKCNIYFSPLWCLLYLFYILLSFFFITKTLKSLDIQIFQSLYRLTKLLAFNYKNFKASIALAILCLFPQVCFYQFQATVFFCFIYVVFVLFVKAPFVLCSLGNHVFFRTFQ